MKNKILVEIIVPDIDQSYEVFIPINRKVGSVIELLNRAILELSDGIFKGDNKTCLYDKETNLQLDINKTIAESKIKNGATLVLF